MNWWNRMVCAVVGHQVGTVPVTESFWWRNDAGWQHELRCEASARGVRRLIKTHEPV